MRVHAPLAAAFAVAMVWIADANAAKAFTIDPLNQVMEVAKAANARAGPGTNFAVLRTLDAGIDVRVTGSVRNRNWLRVNLRERWGSAYVYAPLLREEGAPTGLKPLGPGWSVTENQPCHVWRRSDADKYEPFTWWGACVDGKASGDGRLVWHTRSGRNVYEGSMAAGKLHGIGTWRRSDGALYKGEWRDGKRHGTGSYKWAAGHRYEGKWNNDRPHGFGTATFADGDVHQGSWRKGCYGERDGIWSALIATVEDCGFN